jgi:hypothetical protein
MEPKRQSALLANCENKPYRLPVTSPVLSNRAGVIGVLGGCAGSFLLHEETSKSKGQTL